MAFNGRHAESPAGIAARSEEHTSELQSHHDLVCRLLLEKKKKNPQHNPTSDTPTSARPSSSAICQDASRSARSSAKATAPTPNPTSQSSVSCRTSATGASAKTPNKPISLISP